MLVCCTCLSGPLVQIRCFPVFPVYDILAARYYNQCFVLFSFQKQVFVSAFSLLASTSLYVFFPPRTGKKCFPLLLSSMPPTPSSSYYCRFFIVGLFVCLFFQDGTLICSLSFVLLLFLFYPMTSRLVLKSTL